MSIYTGPDKATLEKFATDLFAEYKDEVAALGYTVTPQGIVGKRASDGQDVPDAALVAKWIDVPSNVNPANGFDFKEESIAGTSLIGALNNNSNISLAYDFTVFDAMLFSNKPDLNAAYGIPYVQNLGYLHGLGTNVDEEYIKSNAIYWAPLRPYVSLDKEDLCYDKRVCPDEIDANIDVLIQMYDIWKSVSPNQLVGYYGIGPIRDYFTPVTGTTEVKEAWYDANAALYELCVNHCDMLFPSIYTFYDDQPNWVVYAEANIAEAKKYTGRKIYPFIWPYYHDSNPTLGGTPIPGDYWRLQLDTIYNSGAHGVVIWGGYQIEWDDNAEWWLETLDFMANL